jgi:DNA-binding response OmpR family regulator
MVGVARCLESEDISNLGGIRSLPEDGMEKILVIDSNKSRRSFVVPMQEAGFRVVEAEESKAGVQRALDDEHCLIILSEDMPAVAGRELLPTLRQVTDSLIVVIGSGDRASLVQALRQGADRYLTRTVDINELLAHIKALLRRYSAVAGDVA